MKAIIVLILLNVLAYNVSAEGQLRGGSTTSSQSAQAKIQYLMKQLTAERDQALAENDQLKQKIEKLDAKLSKLDGKLDKSSSTLGKFKESNNALRDKLVETQEKFQELVGKFRETAISLRNAELEKRELEVINQQQAKSIEKIIADNKKLYTFNQELIEKYENKGLWAAFRQKEPITQLKKVEMENIVEKYRNESESLLVKANPIEEKAL